ncbi:MAG: dihydrolipoamide acetyltransferase family protein [Alphaproteobacteria bacterium]
MKTFTLPDLGEGLQEAEIVTWHVSVGDQVDADQPLVSVETDKAVVEIPAPRAGRIAGLHAAPGDVLKIGAPLVEFEEGAAVDAGTVVGEIAADEKRVEESPVPAGTAPVAVKATPAVRALAQKRGVDLTVIKPGGPDGLITVADVERVAKLLAEAGPLEPLKGVRRAMARNMSQAHVEAVPATVSDEADIDHWPSDADVTVRLIRAVAAGCRAEPALNAWYDSRAVGRRLLQRIDLGIAVDTEDGLFVPVMHDVGNRSAEDLRRGLDRMKADVKARRVPPEEMRGQTITLSNFGTIGGRFASLVVVPPQVAIVGAGRVSATVVAVEGKPMVHRMLPVSITFDHRAVTGGEAARFLAALIEDLERAA